MHENGEPHSLAHIGDHRMDWWNADFLALLASRAQLHKCRRLLDVGVGEGHWLASLLRVIELPREIAVLDFERHWLERVRTSELHSSTAEQGCTWEFLHGDCHAIPSASDRFDCVTCQTVLMHLPDPTTALREFVRVARPGGVVLVAESVNLLNRAPISALSFRLRPDAHAQLFCFWRPSPTNWGCGPRALGDHSLGVELPALFRAAGLVESRFFCNDCPVLADVAGGADLRDHLPAPSTEDYLLATRGGATAELLAWTEAFFSRPADYLLPEETRPSPAGPILVQAQLIVGVGFKPHDNSLI